MREAKNGDSCNVFLSEKEVLESHQYDTMPLIYYRVSKPLKDLNKLPKIKLGDFYELLDEDLKL